jgi:hypothetical protein
VELGVNIVWSKGEKNFVRKNAARLKDRELAAALTRTSGRVVTVHAVRKCRARLGIKKKHGRGVCQVVRPVPPKASAGLTIKARCSPPVNGV